MDTITQSQRHTNMSHIHGKNNSIEKKIRSALHRAGFRFRVCDRRYPGSPDLVLPKYNAVIFVNGCFWHAHENCSYYRMTKSNVEFWQKKFTHNKQRDEENLAKYQETNSLQRIDDSFKKNVVVKDDIEPWIDEKAIQYIGVQDFLQDEGFLR
nr:very short patch repair endonuclease [uncultured Treponema sp.]